MLKTHHLITELYSISYLLSFFMIFGVISCGISGSIRAIEAKMDITGAVLLSFITANAGGTIRDIILDTEVFWVKENMYIWLPTIAGVLTFSIIYFNRSFFDNKKLRLLLIITDAMGLAAFSLAGTEKSINLGETPLIVLIMGVWTAIGGGVIADIIANRVPIVFSQELYISIAFLGSLAYLILYHQLSPIFVGMIAAMLMIILRLCSVKFRWKFPTIN